MDLEVNHRCETMPERISVTKFMTLPWKVIQSDEHGGQYINITHCPYCGKELQC